jgi:hypothetical protein
MIFFTVLGSPHLTADDIPGPKSKATNLGLGYIDVISIRMEISLAQKPVALIHNLEDASSEGETVLLGICLK